MDISMVSCQRGPTCHAYAWQIGPFWQDTLDLGLGLEWGWREVALPSQIWGFGKHMNTHIEKKIAVNPFKTLLTDSLLWPWLHSVSIFLSGLCTTMVHNFVFCIHGATNEQNNFWLCNFKSKLPMTTLRQPQRLISSDDIAGECNQ